MQITKAEVTPLELKLRQPAHMAGIPPVASITAIFVRLETVNGLSAWGCTVAHPDLTGDEPQAALRTCQECAARIPDLPPLDLEYSLAELAPLTESAPSALCAFDLAFHDLLGQATGLPLYKLLGGYRASLPTSVTVPLAPLEATVELAERQAENGFRALKIKGGLDPGDDVERVLAVHRALPELTLRLDPDGGYTVKQAIDVTRALANAIEMIEEPTAPGDLESLGEVTHNSPVPVMADQSARGPASVLELAARHLAHGVSVKVACCGGLRCAAQADAIARAARLVTMVGCLIEPALLITAGLSFALSSPNVRYADLDGHLDLLNDPSRPGFELKDGWLFASGEPGLGCKVRLG